MNEDSWERLSVYESQDLVSHLYRIRHEEALHPSKASEITASFVQGRQFFTSAGTAEDLARPLLLYYGVLALARGLVLFLDKRMRLTSLKPSHGVEAKGWSDALLKFGGGAVNIPDLTISLTGSGTFGQLTEVTENKERWRVFGIDYPFEFRGVTPGSSRITPTEFTLRELLARVPDLSMLFEKTLLSGPDCHALFVYVYDVDTYTDVEVFESASGFMSANQLAELFELPSSTTPKIKVISDFGLRFIRSQDQFAPNIDVVWTRIPHASRNELLPHLARVKNDRAGNIFLVAPIRDETLLSSMSMLFLLSYVMGMLVRYYPSVWQSLVARESGDIVYPLLRAAMALVRDRFPDLVVDELEEVHPKFPRVA